jgi:hypothetical protein
VWLSVVKPWFERRRMTEEAERRACTAEIPIRQPVKRAKQR